MNRQAIARAHSDWTAENKQQLLLLAGSSGSGGGDGGPVFDVYRIAGLAAPIEVESPPLVSGGGGGQYSHSHNLTLVTAGEGETLRVYGANFGPPGAVVASMVTQAGRRLVLPVANQVR